MTQSALCISAGVRSDLVAILKPLAPIKESFSFIDMRAVRMHTAKVRGSFAYCSLKCQYHKKTP